MARVKKVPSVVIDYDDLSDELKTLYDKLYEKFDEKNIYALREEAAKLCVESPTTLDKKALVKRVTDRVMADYLPSNVNKGIEPWELFKDSADGVHIRGVFEQNDGKYCIGRILVPAPLVKDNYLRSGDLVDGMVADIDDKKTLVAVQSVENNIPVSRRWFEDVQTAPSRAVIIKEDATTPFTNLNTGERIIYSTMTMDEAAGLLKAFPISVGLFVGLAPEYEATLALGSFIVPFDRPKADVLRIARLAVERAKRLAERGCDVVLVVYGFECLKDQDVERAIFGLGRSFERGSVTVIADLNLDENHSEFKKVATRIM